MSWEVMSETVEKCECGKGTITDVLEMDDWNNSRSWSTINCKDCYEKALERKTKSNSCPNPVKHDTTKYFYVEE